MLRNDRLHGMAPNPFKKLSATGETGSALEPAMRHVFISHSGKEPVGVRRRLGRFGAPRGGVNRVLEPLIRTVRNTHPKADVKLIEQAYEVAARCHANQYRKSGDPYITHPLAVATILAELGMNHETLCAALLHDTIEY